MRSDRGGDSAYGNIKQVKRQTSGGERGCMREIHFGFSYVGHENRILLMMERVGEVLVSCFALIFSDFNIRSLSGWSWWLAVSFGLMVLYEIFWIRYFKSEKTMRDFYSSLLGVPVAGATLPVMSFLLLAVYGKNVILGAAVVILGIGHIGIHLMHRREIEGK